MSSHFDLVLTNADVVLPWGETRADIGIRQGKIAFIGHESHYNAARILDLKGLTILPGMIDSQVHFRDPGHPHKETLETGMKSALLGGITAILEMPNTKPSTTTAAALNEKLEKACSVAYTHYGFFIGAADENTTSLGSLEVLPGCCGVKMFMGSSTGSLLVQDDASVSAVLHNGRKRMAVHSEDEARLKERFYLAEQEGHARAHPVWRDEEVCLRSTMRLIGLARQAGRPVHVLHITTGEEMAFLSHQKDIATVETLVQHLTLSAPECYERLGTYAQMNPPIRDERHQNALWQAVHTGIVDVIASDHAPHTKEEKDQPYPKSPAGLPGTQTLLPLMLTHVHNGKLSLLHLTQLMADTPARLYGMKGKGRIAVGYDADLTIIDRHKSVTLSHAMMASQCGWTPYDGMTVTGWPEMVLLNGEIALQDGAITDERKGQQLNFW